MIEDHVLREDYDDLLSLLAIFSSVEEFTALTEPFNEKRIFHAGPFEAAPESPAEFLGWCLLFCLDTVCSQLPRSLEREEEEVYDLMDELRVLMGQIILLEPVCTILFKYRQENELQALFRLASRLSRLLLTVLRDDSLDGPMKPVEYFLEKFGFETE